MFFLKCVPLLHETILFCKSTEICTHGYVNNTRNLPTSRTQRTQDGFLDSLGDRHASTLFREKKMGYLLKFET